MNQPDDNHGSMGAEDPGFAHIDDIVEGEDWPNLDGSKTTTAASNRETGDQIGEFGGRRVGDIGVIHGQRVRITAIYNNGKFDYELLGRAR